MNCLLCGSELTTGGCQNWACIAHNVPPMPLPAYPALPVTREELAELAQLARDEMRKINDRLDELIRRLESQPSQVHTRYVP